MFFINGYIILKTALGEDMRGLLSLMSSDAYLRPISNAAAIVTALLGPIPSNLHRFSIDIPARQSSFPSLSLSIDWAISNAFSLSVPVLSMIASSSALLREAAPFSSIFSLGLSSTQSSFSFIVFLREVRLCH